MKKTFFLQATIIALFLILSATTSAYSQQADSLINVLNTQKLTPAEQLVLYGEICRHADKGDIEKLTAYAEKGLDLAEKEEDEKMVVAFNSYLGNSCLAKENYDGALVYYEKALVLAQAAKKENWEANMYLNIAATHSYQFKHETALQYYMKALSIYEKTGYKEGCVDVFYNITMTHLSLNNHDRALYYLEQAKAIAEELNDPNEMFQIYHLLQDIHFNKGEFDKTLEYVLKTIEITHSIGHKAVEISALTALARVYSMGFEDYDKAEKSANEALRLAEELGSLHAIVSARLSLAKTYFNQKRYKECDAFASIAYELDSANIDTKRFATKNIVLANIFLGNTTKAASFFHKYDDIVMQYSDKSFHQSLSEMEVKYETEKKELYIAEIEKEKVFYMSLGIVGGILLLALLFLFIILHRLAVNKRKLAEQQIQQVATQSVLDGETAERTRIARDLHDGLGGMLSLVKLNLEDLENLQNARDMLDQSINELRRVAHHMMPESLLRYGLKASLEDFCLSVPNAKFNYYGDDSHLDDRIEILIYRCAYELVNNAIKHAKASTINVQLVQGPDRISLTVHDDGCGFDTAMIGTPKLDVSTSGMGLENLRVRVAACKGSLNLYSSPGKGTEAYVKLSLKNNN